VAKTLGTLQVSTKAFEYSTDRGGIMSALVSDRQAVAACLQFAGVYVTDSLFVNGLSYIII